MGLHGMRLTVKDELSIPTEQDKIKDCAPHGGVAAIEAVEPTRDIQDEYKLLRIRHTIYAGPTRATMDGGNRPSSGSLIERLGSNSLSTPRVNQTRQLYRAGQKAPEVENQLRELGEDRFDGRYIELDAGLHEPYLRAVANDMETPGNPLNDLIKEFRNRNEVHKREKPEMRVQLGAVKLGNGLGRTFYRHCPGFYEDEAGDEIQYTEDDVFVSRGTTYVKQDVNEPDDDTPKLSAEQESEICRQEKTEWKPEKKDLRRKARWVSQNKPDITNKRYKDVVIPHKGPLWRVVTKAFEVKPFGTWDCLGSLVARGQRYQVNHVKHFPATGEILTMTICGPIVRVWYMNPQRFGSSRGFSLDDPKDTYDIVKVFALFSGPVSNYLPHWKPVAGPKGRLAMKTIDDKPFLLELKDIGSLDTRYDPYGRRTAVWSAGVAQVLSDPGENGPPPPITLEPDEHLVIKTSWQLPHLRMHEQEVYKHLAKKEKELAESEGFKRDEDVAIPELVGTLRDDSPPLECIGDKSLAQWKTRLVRRDPLGDDDTKTERKHFTGLVTKCRRAKPIGQERLDEYEKAEIYRKLFKNLEHLGLLGVHYRDLNPGNILCDKATLSCLLADLDFARIGTQRRPAQALGQGAGQSERELKEISSEERKLLDTSLDDCISGSLLFMTRHVQKSRELEKELTRLELARESRSIDLENEKLGEPDKSRHLQIEIDATRRWKRQDAKITEKMHEIAKNPHQFIDDLESAIYTWLWISAEEQAKDSGLICGPSYPIGWMDEPHEKEKIWDNVYKYAKPVVNEACAHVLRRLATIISDTQDETKTRPAQEDLNGEELSGYKQCYPVLREFYESRPKPDQHETATPTDPKAYLPREEKPLLGRTDRMVKRKPTESAQDDQPARGQELPQSFASLSIKDASAESASPNAGPSTSIRSKLRPRDTKINYRL